MSDTGLAPEGPFTLEEQNRMLLRFAKRVRDQDHPQGYGYALAVEAEELLTLFGDPDAPKPQGVIRA